MISIIFIFYLLLATCFSKQDRLTTNVSPSLNDLNLLKKPLNLYITANGVHAVVRNEVRLVEDVKLYYLETIPPFKIKYRGDLLYLHGAAFSSHDWNKNRPSILQMSAAAGYRTIAIDLPGFGSSRSEGPGPSDRAKFMASLMKVLNITKPIIVSPSASGSFSVPYVLANQDKLSGFVPVAPCCVHNSGWEKFTVPTLLIYGEQDKASISKYLLSIPIKNLAIIPDAPHAAYTKKPIEFMTVLVNFMDFIHPR